MTIRVVLAEDNLLVREGVRRLLETRKGSGIEVVGTCGDLPSLLEAVEAQLPDVVLTDIRMPPTHTDEGLQAAAQLRKSYPHVGVVLLSQFDAPVYARALLEEGSAGRAYLLKERVSDPEQLEAAIREVARGGSVIDRRWSKRWWRRWETWYPKATRRDRQARPTSLLELDLVLISRKIRSSR
jgi:DNA-binding NarL/FixJ family response regulator